MPRCVSSKLYFCIIISGPLHSFISTFWLIFSFQFLALSSYGKIIEMQCTPFWELNWETLRKEMVPVVVASRHAPLLAHKKCLCIQQNRSSSQSWEISLVQSSFQEVGVFACLGEVSGFGWRWSATSCKQSPLSEENKKMPAFLSPLRASQLSNREQKEILAVILSIGNNWSLICDANLFFGLFFKIKISMMKNSNLVTLSLVFAWIAVWKLKGKTMLAVSHSAALIPEIVWCFTLQICIFILLWEPLGFENILSCLATVT